MRYAPRVRALALLLVTAAGLLHAARALAGDPKREEAARAFAAGDQAYAAGQNLAAARAYEAAYELAPLPGMTFSIAQAYRRHYFEDPDIKWLQKAQELYKRYLEEEPKGTRRAHAVTHLGNIAVLITEHERKERGEESGAASAAATEFLVSSTTPGATASIDDGPPQPVPVVQKVTPGPHRVIVSAPGHFALDREVTAFEGRMSIIPMDLAPQPGKLVVVTDPAASVWIDGNLATRDASREPLEVARGTHVVSVTRSGRTTDSRTVRVDGGETKTLNVELETSDQRSAAYWLLGISGAFTLAGASMAILAAVSESEAIDARSPLTEKRALTPEQARDSNEALERRDLARGLAIGGFGAGALAGITGTFVFVFDNPLPATAPDRDSASAYGLQFVGTF